MGMEPCDHGHVLDIWSHVLQVWIHVMEVSSHGWRYGAM